MGIMGGKAQGPIQVDPSLATSMTDKAGQLGKKPDLSLRFPWKQWPKKYCTISMMNGFTLANSHVSVCVCVLAIRVTVFLTRA